MVIEEVSTVNGRQIMLNIHKTFLTDVFESYKSLPSRKKGNPCVFINKWRSIIVRNPVLEGKSNGSF